MSCTLHTLLYMAVLAAIPGIEGRYAVLAAPCPAAVLTAYASSTAVGLTVYLILERLVSLLSIHAPTLYTLYARIEERLKRRLSGASGLMALIAFIAAPLPGSGVWSGAVAAKLLGLEKRAALVGIAIGNLMAVMLVYMVKTLGLRLLGA